MKTKLQKALYPVMVTIISALGFYGDQWQTVDISEVQYKRSCHPLICLSFTYTADKTSLVPVPDWVDRGHHWRSKGKNDRKILLGLDCSGSSSAP